MLMVKLSLAVVFLCVIRVVMKQYALSLVKLRKQSKISQQTLLLCGAGIFFTQVLCFIVALTLVFVL